MREGKGRLARLKSKLFRRSSSSVPEEETGETAEEADPHLISDPTAGPSRALDSEIVSDSALSSNVDTSLEIRSVLDLPDRPESSGTNTAPISPQTLLQHRPLPSNTPPPTEPRTTPLNTPLTELPFSLQTPLPSPPCDYPPQLPLPEIQSPNLDSIRERVLDGGRTSLFPPHTTRPTIATRRRSFLPESHQQLINDLPQQFFAQGEPRSGDPSPVATQKMQRRVWVKRAGGSATTVACFDDTMVDELRDQVIRKYANSLGRTFDSPEITIRILNRVGSGRAGTPDRLLSPDELLSSLLDSYYPGGQKVEEALLIEAPASRTPKPSPRHLVYHHHRSEPGEHGEYFPIMPTNVQVPTPPTHGAASTPNPPSISILNTGQAPLVPSPGSRAPRHHRRPPLNRHTTNSPTILGQLPAITGKLAPCIEYDNEDAYDAGSSSEYVDDRVESLCCHPCVYTSALLNTQSPPIPPPQAVPTPPIAAAVSPQAYAPVPGVSPRNARRQKVSVSPGITGGMIPNVVPPINVLIVEDNIINQRLLEAFLKRMNLRWKCAANGQEAVRKWREGGFHVVLMDIQLPVMNGLEATREIRRLEDVNGIGGMGPFRGPLRTASTPPPDERPDSLPAEDRLADISKFKSRVIIVALTASSLESDRAEALVAGCNDFLTKPVAFPWLNQKMTEWGSMQALIDFGSWRIWRGFATPPESSSENSDAPSPMQSGHRRAPQPEVGSPSVNRRLRRPQLPPDEQVLRADSWGSGSGNGDTADSFTSPDLPDNPSAGQ